MKDFVFYDTSCICVDDLCDFYITTSGKSNKKNQLNLVYPTTTRCLVFDTERGAHEFYLALVKYVDAEPLDVFNYIEVITDKQSGDVVVPINKKKT